MTLSYLPVNFHLCFASPAIADNPPLFVLRSVLGKELRSMCCIAHKSVCAECMYNHTCAYSFLFESILPQQNEVVPGRNRASHPFAFTQGDLSVGAKMSEYDFTITLFGKAVDYLPYIYAAFARTGKNGLFKARTPFIVKQVIAGGKNILIDENQLDFPLSPKIFEIATDGENRKGQILVELKSPLRFKTGGKYTTDFSAQDFMGCLFRRANTLCQLYGSNDGIKYEPNKTLSIIEKNLHWTESTHYSVRQKNKMELGGLIGTFKISGTFTPTDLALLELAKIANAGKNTNFGLGKLDFWTKWG